MAIALTDPARAAAYSDMSMSNENIVAGQQVNCTAINISDENQGN